MSTKCIPASHYLLHPQKKYHTFAADIPIDCSEEIRLLKLTSIFKHVVELNEDTAINMCCQSNLLDQALQMCSGRMWVKSRIMAIYMNRITL